VESSVRILHVINRYWPAVGGAELHLQEYAERQAAEGFDVTVFTTDADDFEYFWDRTKKRVERPTDQHNGVRIERFPIVHLPPNGLSFRVMRRLLGEIDRLPGTTALLRRLCRFAPFVPSLDGALHESPGRWDVVHGMNVTLEALLYPALWHARAAGAPFVLSPLLHLGESPRSLVRRYYTMKHQLALVRRADAVLVQTPTEARYLVGRGVGAERLIPGGAGVEPDRIVGGDGAAFRRRHGLDGPIVFYLGAMHPDKGALHLVEAMERVWARGGAAALVLAGASMAPFERFWAGRPAETKRRTLRLGRVSDAEKRDLFAAGDVFAMPSRTDSFGIVFLEAWLSGVPVVAAAAGGVPDVVEHERSGLVVPFGDVDAIASSIERLVADPALRRRLAEHGASQTRERWTWERVYERVRPAFVRAGHERLGLARRAIRRG
jgi:glycosyltransferase involved in cell wall biosynthesis